MNGRSRHSAARLALNKKSATENPGRRHKPDYWILVLTALLLTIGLVVVYSISPGLAASQHVSQGFYITKHLVAVLLGIVVFAAAAFIPLNSWKKSADILAITALIGCVIVMFTPIDAVYQAHRWIRFGGVSFQVAELIKVALIIWLAKFLTDRWQQGKLADFNATLRPILILLAFIGVVVVKLQSDLGSAGVIVAVILLMSIVVGVPMRKVAYIGILVGILAVLAVATSSYRQERIQTFLHPESNCQDSGYQACQALISVGSGGIFGLGLGYSVQAYGYLPEASNDSIFAIMAEKFGFIGTVIILVIYGVFITRLKSIIERTSDQFSRLVVVGVLAWLSTQMIINVGAMVGLLPLKGITLPLISQGGTSLIFLTASLGIVFHISRYTSYNATEPDESNIKKSDTNYSVNGGRVRRPHNPTLVSRPRA